MITGCYILFLYLVLCVLYMSVKIICSCLFSDNPRDFHSSSGSDLLPFTVSFLLLPPPSFRHSLPSFFLPFFLLFFPHFLLVFPLFQLFYWLIWTIFQRKCLSIYKPEHRVDSDHFRYENKNIISKYLSKFQLAGMIFFLTALLKTSGHLVNNLLAYLFTKVEINNLSLYPFSKIINYP